MYRLLFVALASLLLAACGRGDDDFTVKVNRPAQRVAAAFDQVSVDSEIGAMVPGLKVVRTKPSPDTVVYTVPGDGSFQAVVKLTFEAADGGKTTVVRGVVNVPSTVITFDGKKMVISESKVERIFAGILRSAASKLEEGRDIANEQRDFARMLTVLAIVTDSKKLRLAQEISTYPEWYMAGLGWLSDGNEGADNPYGDYAGGEDPAAAARQEEYKQKRDELEEKAKAEEAAAPMEQAEGDYVGGSEE